MGQQISPTKATELCDNFDTKYADLCRQISKDDNRSCYFTLKELKDYISYLEQSDNNIDGIRIYLGSHGSDNLSTVFLAPTSNGVDDVKLNAYNWGNGGRPPKKKYGK
jgi:hypothetical protein